MYGTSTSNQRIESWWAQLTKTATGIWIQFFGNLRTTDQFSKDRNADVIALLAVYFPVIRLQVEQFVDNWNTHQIRKQPYRPKTISGRPYNLFWRPRAGIKNYGLEVDTEKLEELRRDVTDWGKLISFYLNVCVVQ